jgi:predicted acylesterase/phospholipase RssA
MASSPSTPAPIQVVFQGGGAKLCLLMAVADVLQQYQTAGRIEIKRAAGSSAGAIAAVMLASGKPIGTYKAELKTLARSYLHSTKVPRWIGTCRVMSGIAYFKELYLENFFKELFCSGLEAPKSIKDLKIKDTRIYYTDLYSLESRSTPDYEAIPKALARSCRLPFAFVGFNAGDTQVDGGLALNFPVDELKLDESTLGSVIGVSFANAFGTIGNNNLLSYTQQLFSAAIQSGVTRSELILGKSNVYPIDTTIGTFDFERALDQGLSLEYDLTANKFDTWLATWLKTSGPIQPMRSQSGRKLLRPSFSDLPLPTAIIREINDRFRTGPIMRARTIGSYETAILNGDGTFTGKYLARTTTIFDVVRSTNVLQFDFQIGKGGSFATVNLGCAALDSKGRSLAFVPHIEELTKSKDILRSFRVYFLFDGPITPESANQPYRVEYQYEADDPYPNLDTVDAAALTLRQGDADVGVYCVAFPRAVLGPFEPRITDIAQASTRQFKAAEFEVDEDEVITQSEMLSLFDFVDDLDLQHAPERYRPIGRRARNIKQGEMFGFVVEKTQT